MSRIHLLILWILAITAGVIYFKSKETDQSIDAKTTLETGSDLISGNLVDEIDGFKVTNGEKTATISKVNGQWTVSELGNFPANIRSVANVLRSLRNAKISQGVVASEEYYDRFNLDPGHEDKDKHPEAITFISGGEEALTLYLGKSRSSSGGGNQTAGRFVRLSDDDSGIYVVSESFAAVTFDPDSWIEKVLTPLKEQAIGVEVSAPNDESFKGWKATRKTVMDDFVIGDLGEKEETKAASTTPLKNAFTSATFTELVSSEDFEKRADKKGTRVVKATDSAGSNFQITIVPEKKKDQEPEAQPGAPAPQNNYLVSIELLNGPTEPKALGEDATVQEKAIYQERLANLQSLRESTNRMTAVYKGRYFLVSKATVDPFLKNRGELVQPKKEKKPPVSVTTPPIQIPGTGKPNNGIPPSIARPDANEPKKPKIEAVTPPIRVPPLPNKNGGAKPDEANKPADKPKPPEDPKPGDE
ncbi:MAG: DUF4340 domain-containing protein [Akkermansiaceae bacterium]|jgi:hypothetical protein